MPRYEEIMNELNRKRTESETSVITLYDVYVAIGLIEDNELERALHPEWLSCGWSSSKGFHKLTFKELHPTGCPCCGRPW